MTTVSELATFLRRSSERVGAQFTDPNDDWVPVGHILDSEDRLGVIGIDTEFFANDARKDDLVQEIIGLIQGLHAKAFGLITSAWSSKVPANFHPEREYDEEFVRPKDDPNRREMLTIQVTSADEEEFWWAEIKRDGENPPTLGEWEKTQESTGRFVEPILDALKIERRNK